MTASRSGRRAAQFLTEKQILAISILAALVIAASIALVSGKTVGQALGGYLIAQDTMLSSPTTTYTPPPTDTTYTPPPTTTYTPPPTETYTGTPYTGTTGTTGTTGGSYLGGGMTMTKEQCLATCVPMIDTAKASCESGCNNMGSYTGTPYTGTTGTTGTTSGTPTSGTTTGSTSDPKAMCYSGCNSMPPDMQTNCRIGCDRMSAPSTGSTGGADAATCKTRCTIGYMPGATPEMLDSCMKACDNMASSGGSGMYPSAGSMGSCMTGARGVRYANARYKENGVETSGPIYCAGFDAPPCTKGSASGGPQVEVLSYAGAPTGCDTPASGMYPATGGGGTEPASGERCFFPATWKQGTGNTGGSLSCTSSKTDCREYTESGKPVPPGDIVGSIGSPTSCYKPSSGQWNGGGGGSVKCTYPNGKVLWCSSPHVSCSESPGGPILSSESVGRNGATANCESMSSGGGQWNTGGDPREQWIMSCMSAKSLSRPMCEAQCTPGNGCPQTGGQWNTGGGTEPASGERCFFPATWKQGTGNTGGSLSCTPGKTDCREYTESGKPVPPGDIVGAIGSPTSCYKPSSGQWNTGGGNSCVSGCKNMTESSCANTMGDSQFWCKHWRAGTCDQACKEREGGGQQGSMDCVIDACRGSNLMCMAPAYSVRCDSKECMTNSNCRPAGSGGGGWSGGDEMVECCAPTPQCNSAICPAMMPMCQRRTKSECQRDGWNIIGYDRRGGGGGQQWNDLNGLKTQMLHPLQNYRRQAGEMALRARESGADISADGDAYIKAIDAAVNCITGAATQDALNGCGQFKAIEQLSMNIWNKIQAAGMNWQFKDIERRMQEMKKFADQIKKGGANVQQLEGILNDMAGAISSVKSAMASNSATPEMTRTDKIFALESEFWRAAEMLKGSFQDDRRYGGHEGDFSYADQCEMIRRKMEYVGGDNYAAASQLQDMYGKCIKQAQGAMTGKGFDERQFAEIQDQFDEYGDQNYAEKACAMADRAMNEAGNAINKEAPMMIQMLGGKNSGAAAKLNGLLAKAKELLNRAYGHRQSNDCNKALMVMGDMEKMGQEADRIMSQAGISFGGQNNMEFVDYEDQRDDISQKISKEAGTSVKQLKKRLEEEGFGGAELAILDAMDPRLAARLFEKGASEQGADIVKAAANADISATKLEAIIEENAQLLKKVADLELQMQNLKAGVKTIVENIKNETFNPKIAPKIASLIETASTMTEKEFRAKYEEYKNQSNKENVKAGIDPFEDVHTFDKGHEWFVVAVKDGVENGLFKGKGDGTFDPNGPVLRQDMAIVIARDQEVDDNGDAPPESAFAQKASAYAKEALAGLEGIGVDFSEFSGAPTGAATRLEVARMVAAVYGDDLSETDDSVLEEYVDIDGLADNDRDAVAMMVANDIMTGTDDKFNPGGTFNRAQFATVMHRLDEAAGMAIVDEDDEEGFGAATAKPAGTMDAAESADHAAAAEPEPQPPVEVTPEPVYHLSDISWNELKAIMSLVSSYVSKHPLELGISDVTKALVNIDTSFLSDYKIYGSDVVAKKRIALSNQLLDKPLAKLKEILLKAGQPGE